ncbi:LysR family transcriptional regulator [Gluconacetobacter sp.]|uniref:LysR family transcriptional regulator n=1 Tax=Gluconacetobacter sp. TaxID=1935994 RepID=UPI0039E900B0
MDIATVDLNLLKVLDALLAENSVSGAARRLRLSQPATSAALGRLRRLLNDPLLIRRGNVMVLTACAEELRPRIASLLEGIANTLDRSSDFDPRTSTRRFRVLSNEYAAQVIFLPIARHLRDIAPHVTLEILPFDPRFEERLASHDCDLAISHADFLRPTRHIETLFTDRYVSAVRSDHPRLQNIVSLEAFIAEDHVLITSHGRTRGPVDHALADAGYTRRVVTTLPHYLLAPALIAGSDLVMTVPHAIARTFQTNWPLRLFDPPLSIETFDMAMAWHPRTAGDMAIEWLRQLVRNVATTALT